MPGHHAVVAPSKLYLTVECQAWIGLTLKMAPELLTLMTAPTEESLEGDAADWVAKEYAQGREVAFGTPTPVPGITVDHDMIHGAKLWRDTVGYGGVMDVPVVCHRIHPTDCWGVPDFWRWDAIEGILRLPEYKYGFGLHDVFEHWQLIGYLAGILDSLNLRDDEVIVEFIVVQPRAFHPEGPVRRWKIRADQLRAQINIAHTAAIAAYPPKATDNGKFEGHTATAKSGPHCLHCPARPVCGTFQQSVSAVLEFTGAPSLSAMDPDAVGVQLTLVHEAGVLLKAAETALEAQAEAFLRGGKRVTNYRMEPGQARLSWNAGVTTEEVASIAAMVAPGVTVTKPPALITPLQATKAGLPDAIVSQYASRPAGAMKLARETVSEARRAFGSATITSENT